MIHPTVNYCSFFPMPSYQGQLWVCAGIHPKLKVTGTQAQHCTSLSSQDGRGQQGISQTGARRHRDQVGACALFAIQRVDEGRQLLCVHLLQGVVVGGNESKHVDQTTA